MKTTPHSQSKSEQPLADAASAAADQPTEALSDKTARLQDDVGHMVQALSEQVAELAREARRLSIKKSSTTQDALAVLADECSAYVRGKPLQSVAIAAATGALFALLLGRRD
jgi:ElaB/YqjD/DUF883 family membrane-anchored ribosome-binding protein